MEYVECTAYDPFYSNIYYPETIQEPIDQNNPALCGVCGGELITIPGEGIVCCGNAENEYTIHRKMLVGGTITEYTNDQGCCTLENMCVSSGVCYTHQGFTTIGSSSYKCNNNVWEIQTTTSSSPGGPGIITSPTLGNIRLVSTSSPELFARPSQNVTIHSEVCNYGGVAIPQNLSVIVNDNITEKQYIGFFDSTVPSGGCGNVVWVATTPEEGFTYSPFPEISFNLGGSQYLLQPSYPLISITPTKEFVDLGESVEMNVYGLVFINNTYVKANLTAAVLKVYSPQRELLHLENLGELSESGKTLLINPARIKALDSRHLVTVEASSVPYRGLGGSSFIQTGYVVPHAGEALEDYLAELNK